MIEIPNFLMIALAIIGVAAISIAIWSFGNIAIHYIKYKTFPANQKDLQINLLNNEISKLNKQLSNLEKENEEITKAILRRIE